MNKQRRAWLAIGTLLLAAVMLGGSQLGRAADASHVSERYGLRGLKGFYVQVDSLPFDVEQKGLTRQAVQRDVELQLRKGGAIVLTHEQATDAPNAPRLHVRILTSKTDHGGFYAYAILLNFDQGAVLARDAAIHVDATTWSKAGVGMVKTKKVDDLCKLILENVDEFLNVYLSENPKP
jgi:hypothetical protein